MSLGMGAESEAPWEATEGNDPAFRKWWLAMAEAPGEPRRELEMGTRK